MDPIQKIIAHNLSSIRKKRGLSLDKVAELSGVSKAMLAQIENGKSNPTVTTLWKIANGLQVSFSYFMQEEERPKIEKVSIRELTPVDDNEGNYVVYSIFPFHPEKKFEIYLVHLQPGESHTSEKHLGEEYVLIQQGELTIEIQEQSIHLTKDQFIKFQANATHTYINDSNKLVSYYIVIYYPDEV